MGARSRSMALRVAAAAWAAGFLCGCGGPSAGAESGQVGVPPYGLRGQVLTEAGAPVAGAEVQLFASGEATPLTETSSAADGWFAFLVMDGDYRIEVSAPGYRVEPTGEEATVAGQDLSVPAFVATPAP